MIHENSGDGTVSIGRIFSRAFSFVMNRPAIALGSAFLFGALPAVLNQKLMLDALPSTEDMSGELAAGFLGLQFLSMLVAIVFGGIMQAIITRGLVTEHEGGRPSFGQCMAQGLKFAIPIVILTILWWFAIMAGLFLLIVPGLILTCMWAVSIPALVEEGTGVLGAFGRSRELTRGHRWKIFGLLAVILIGFYLAMAVMGIVGLSVSDDALAATEMSPPFLIVTAASGLIFGLLWATVQPSLFVELRDAKEGGSAGDLQQVFS